MDNKQININSLLILLIIFITMFPYNYSFPYYNIHSLVLKNGNIFLIHKKGIDICDKYFQKKIKTEILFSDEEQITDGQMKNILIKKFDDEYLICLIIDKVYIFDDSGNFLNKNENINNGKAVNFYSLNIYDNYHYFIGILTEESLNLYYYEYNKTTNETIKIAYYENIKITYYSYQNNGLNCYIMNNPQKGETLACFLVLSYDSKYYLSINYYKVNENTITEDTEYDSSQKEYDYYQVGYFNVDINSDKTKALICSFLSVGDDLCFYFDITQNQFEPFSNKIYLNDIYSYEHQCLKDDYKFKVNYLTNTDQFIFSCLGDNGFIIYVIYYFDNDNTLKYIVREFNKTDECIDFNGYDIFYSEENHYYLISDYICNKSLDISDLIIEEEGNEKLEETKSEQEVIEEEGKEINREEEITAEKEPMKEETTIKKEEIEEKGEEGYICQLEKCLKCDEISESQNLCISCNQLKGFYPLKNFNSEEEINNNYIDCYNNLTKPTNYYFNNSQKYYEPCYETCAKCEYGGDKINNNCIECDFGFIFIPGLSNNYNCIVKCPYYFYLTIYGQYKCSKLPLCPDDYYLLIKDKEKCIEDCKKDDEYKYQYNGECYKECPYNSRDNNDYICIDNNINICSLSKREISIKEKIITEEETEQLVKSYAKEFYYTDNHISLFNYSNYEIAIYKNYECISDLSLEIPSVNLGDCYKIIQDKYILDSNLIIAIISQRIKDYPIIISFSVHSPYNGNKIDISDICEKELLNVQEDISMKIEDKEKYNFVEYLTKQNIDIFNLSSKFYSDICYCFDSPIKKDIALKDRIKLFFPNITLCENGCTIKGINSSSMKADCECKINNLISNNKITNNLLEKSPVGDLEDLLEQSNLEILKCSSSLFKHRDISSFIGSFIIISLILIQIALIIVYFVVSVNNLKKYLFNLLNLYLNIGINKDNEPPKKIKNNKKVNFSNSSGQHNKKNRKKKYYKPNKTEIKGSNSEIKTKKENESISLNKSSIKSLDIMKNTKDIEIYTSKNGNKVGEKIESNLLRDVTETRMKIKNEFDINIENYLETELEDLSFEEIKERENRKFCKYFEIQLKSNILIIDIIINNEPFKPRTLKLLIFIINIDLYLFMNALFINEEFISDVFHSKNDKFFSFLPRSIDRIFYTTLVKVIVNYMVDFFFIEEKKIKIILKSKNNTKNDVKIKINQILGKTLKRYIYFIIFTFIITFFSLYYITCFNYRYYYITNEWIKSSIFIIIFMEILSLLSIFIESSLRSLSLKFNSEKLYKLSLIFS